MRFLLVPLCLLAAAAEKPAPPQQPRPDPQKSAPAQPTKKRRSLPSPRLPAGPPRAEQAKTALA
jgi:hypothetical protein